MAVIMLLQNEDWLPCNKHQKHADNCSLDLQCLLVALQDFNCILPWLRDKLNYSMANSKSKE